MMNPVFPLNPDSLSANVKEAEEAGKGLAAQYQSGEPYHHICVDNFLPLSVAEKMREEALAIGEKRPENSCWR